MSAAARLTPSSDAVSGRGLPEVAHISSARPTPSRSTSGRSNHAFGARTDPLDPASIRAFGHRSQRRHPRAARCGAVASGSGGRSVRRPASSRNRCWWSAIARRSTNQSDNGFISDTSTASAASRSGPAAPMFRLCVSPDDDGQSPEPSVQESRQMRLSSSPATWRRPAREISDMASSSIAVS
jgi:hypothetical protein